VSLLHIREPLPLLFHASFQRAEGGSRNTVPTCKGFDTR
jgi:hypothetical protein